MGENDALGAKDVRRMLGVSLRRLRQFEEDGRLHPGRNDRNERVYDRAEVDALVRARAMRRNAKQGVLDLSGELQRRAFAIFERPGCTVAQVVGELGIPAEVVRYLYAQWSTPLGQAPEVPKPKQLTRARPGAATEEDIARFVNSLAKTIPT